MIFVDTMDLDSSIVPHCPRLWCNDVIYKAELEDLSEIVEQERVSISDSTHWRVPLTLSVKQVSSELH